ncbi:MAG: hypothetical protein ABIO70_19980 [Pseudomonadota bacterium]
MRASLTLLTLGLSLTLGACEYYECAGRCGPCDPWSGDCDDDDDGWPWDTGEEGDADTDGDADGDTDTDTDSDTDSPPPPDIHFTLTPAEAEQGQVFIGSLAMSGEDAPAYAAIRDVAFYGDVQTLAVDVRSYEVLVSLAVAADGEGSVDLVVELEDGTAVWEPGVLTIWPAGSGHEADGSGDPDPCE